MQTVRHDKIGMVSMVSLMQLCIQYQLHHLFCTTIFKFGNVLRILGTENLYPLREKKALDPMLVLHPSSLRIWKEKSSKYPLIVTRSATDTHSVSLTGENKPLSSPSGVDLLVFKGLNGFLSHHYATRSCRHSLSLRHRLRNYLLPHFEGVSMDCTQPYDK